MKRNILLIVSFCIAFIVHSTVSKTVNVATAGTLRTLFTITEMTSVTNLTVTGSIDAQDFKFMRDGITNLAVLDIGEVTIQAYNGTGGTSTSASSYQANEIPTHAFFLLNLTSVTIGNSVTSIGDNAFTGCTGLTSLTIPNSVTSIGDYAFTSCFGLASIIIGNSVTSIGSYAFAVCLKLTSLTIGNSVTSIGNSAFERCSELTSINIGNSVTSIGDHAFYFCSKLTSLTIGNSVTSIGSYAFSDCSGLTSLTIPNSVTSIGFSAFYGCNGLTNITIPNSVTSIGDYAFNSCHGLASITIGNSVTSIGSYAFAFCWGLKSIYIGNSVTALGNGTFMGCTELSTIYAYGDTPIVLSLDVFNSVNVYACTLYVPAGSKSAYQAAPIWGDFNIVEMAPTVLSTLISESVNIYPNPVTDGFYVNGLKESGTLVFLDLSGKVLLTKEVKTNEYVSVGNFLKGVYIVKISTANGTIERKVLKN